MAAKILPAARLRLVEIWEYTESRCGEEQADAYVGGLVEAIHQLDVERRRWRRVKAAALSGAFYVRHWHHYVFFRELSGGTLGVISILHESMDMPARLKEDDEG